MLIRILFVVVGLLVNGFAVSLYVASGYGVSTISSVPYILSQSIPWLSLGMAVVAFQIVLLGILVFYIGWKRQYIFSLCAGLVFGMLVDLCGIVLKATPLRAAPPLVHFILGFLLLPLGISFMLCGDLIVLPFDIFTKDMGEKTGHGLRAVKTTFDIVCVSITCAISLLVFKEVRGIGAGTIISMLLTGVIIQSICLKMNKILRRQD